MQKFVEVGTKMTLQILREVAVKAFLRAQYSPPNIRDLVF